LRFSALNARVWLRKKKLTDITNFVRLEFRQRTTDTNTFGATTPILPADRTTGSWFIRISYMQKTNNFFFQTLRFGKLIPIAAWVTLTSVSANADEISDLRAQLASIQKRLETLEKAPVAAETPPSDIQIYVNRQGLVVKDKDNFSFRIQPRLQVDGHFFADEEDGKSEIYIRRLRPIFQGNAGPIAWRFMPELAGTVRILDAWADLSFGSNHYLRVGKIKQTVGLERLQSFSKTLFLERGLPSVLTATRDIGIAFNGIDNNQHYNWTLGVYNGALDDTDLVGNVNLSNGDFDFGVRLELTPWKQSKTSALAGLSFGFAATIGTENTSILDSDRDRRIRYSTSGRRTFFRYNDGVLLDGERTRINPFLTYYKGRFGLLTEFVRSSNELSLSDNRQTVDADAWTFQIGWVLTGENASYNGVRPKKPFAWGNGQLGAFEIGLRAHALELEDAAFSGTSTTRFAHNSAVQKAFSYGTALNWYLTDNLLFALNYEITDFSGLGANRATEEVIISRFQIDF